MVTPRADSSRFPQHDDSVDDGFVRLLMQHQRKLFVFLRTLLSSPTDAEEVLQETFVILWRKRQQYVMGTNFLNWALTIAKFEARRFRRTHKHVPLIAEELLLQIGAEMFADNGLVEARHRALKQCLQTLNEREQGLVGLVYGVHPAEPPEVRSSTLKPGSLRKAIHRVRQRLLKCIQMRLRTEGFA